jgi:hypothetical protein
MLIVRPSDDSALNPGMFISSLLIVLVLGLTVIVNSPNAAYGLG